MEQEIKRQIERVNMLSEMIKERLIAYRRDVEDYEDWERDLPNDSLYHWYPHSKRTNPSEIKRLMLVQRQEMLKLDKLL